MIPYSTKPTTSPLCKEYSTGMLISSIHNSIVVFLRLKWPRITFWKHVGRSSPMLPREDHTRDRVPHCNTGSDFRYTLQHNNPISYFVIMRLELTIPIYVILFLQCRQQKNDELCAIYVCHHMQKIISAKTKDPEVCQSRDPSS